MRDNWRDLRVHLTSGLRADLRPERENFKAKWRLMDVRKFTPVSYKTSASWGRCPKRIEGQKRIDRQGHRGIRQQRL